MENIQLIRTKSLSDRTLGILLYKNNFASHTLELPWQDNKKNISCIPEGRYLTKRAVSGKYGECFRVFDVLGRLGILFHVGNAPSDSRGCILVGRAVAPESNNMLYSKQALQSILEIFPEEFYLTIKTI